jgi:hypothetical protein
MADRYLGNEQDRFAKIGASRAYKIGDLVFFGTSNHTVAGEGLFIGRLKTSPDILVLLVEVVATEDKLCAPTGHNRAAEENARLLSRSRTAIDMSRELLKETDKLLHISTES